MQAGSVNNANTVNTAQNTLSNSKAALAPEMSFDKFLSREMGERNTPSFAAPAPAPVPAPRQANTANNAPPPKNEAANNNAKPAPSANEAEASDAQSETAAIAKGEPSPNSSETSPGKDAANTTTDAAASSTDSSAQALPASSIPADMLALVASFNQGLQKPQQVSQVEESKTTATVSSATLDSATLNQLEKVAGSEQATAGNPKHASASKGGDDAGFGQELANATTDGGKLLQQTEKTGGAREATPVEGGMRKSETGNEQLLTQKVETASSALPQVRSNATPSTEAVPKMADILAAHANKANAGQDSQLNLAATDKIAGPQVMAPVFQANASLTQAAVNQAQNKISPVVGAKGWDEAVGQKVVWMVGNGQQSAELTLNPPDLGPMKVVLSINNDQASVSFTAAQPEVRQALESALPKLREMMNEAGVNLTSSSVSTNMPNQQQANQSQQQHSSSQAGGRHGNDGGRDDGRSESTVQVRTAKVSTGNGMVDTFV